ncbi:hypothetical protein WBP06_22855 [Novosphingobium sp. BL-8H]|uniref:hypothetical protein n=1 Tax=Novosphingobium sp. BL-8H TaxID=3127640 RepID=UPI0037563AC2
MSNRRPGEIERIIEQMLAERAGPVAAYELLKRAAECGIRLYPAQIYRALANLVARGKVNRVEALNAYCKAGSEACAFRVCRDCGRVDPVELGDLHEALSARLAASDFVTGRLVIEALGHCQQCGPASNR